MKHQYNREQNWAVKVSPALIQQYNHCRWWAPWLKTCCCQIGLRAEYLGRTTEFSSPTPQLLTSCTCQGDSQNPACWTDCPTSKPLASLAGAAGPLLCTGKMTTDPEMAGHFKSFDVSVSFPELPHSRAGWLPGFFLQSSPPLCAPIWHTGLCLLPFSPS